VGTLQNSSQLIRLYSYRGYWSDPDRFFRKSESEYCSNLVFCLVKPRAPVFGSKNPVHGLREICSGLLMCRIVYFQYC
jgi:hypothetical protein